MGCPGLRPLLACPCITGAPSGLPQAQALASLPMHYTKVPGSCHPPALLLKNAKAAPAWAGKGSVAQSHWAGTPQQPPVCAAETAHKLSSKLSLAVAVPAAILKLVAAKLACGACGAAAPCGRCLAVIAAMKSVPCCCIRTRGGFLTFPAQYQLLYSPGMAHLASSAESGGEQAPQRSAALIPTINPFQGQITQQTGPGCAHTNLDGPRQSSRPSATPPNVPRQICCLACISSSKRTG